MSWIYSLLCNFNKNITLQEQQFRKRSRTEETRKIQHEKNYYDETEVSHNMVKCFQKNSGGSACSNTAKGIFVSLEEVRDLF